MAHTTGGPNPCSPLFSIHDLLLYPVDHGSRSYTLGTPQGQAGCRQVPTEVVPDQRTNQQEQPSTGMMAGSVTSGCYLLRNPHKRCPNRFLRVRTLLTIELGSFRRSEHPTFNP